LSLLLLALAWGGPIPHPDGALPWFVRPSDDGSFAAMLRAESLSTAQRQQLRGLGLTLRTLGDRPVNIGDVWVVDGSLHALRAARDAGFEVEISRRLDLFPPPILETGTQVQAFDLWASGPTPAEGMRGEGMKILDLDSGIDIFHPHFFRADAGHHRWVDVNDNGVLDAGIDGIDLDGDGGIDGSEVLQLAQAQAYTFDWKAYDFEYIYDSGVLDPSRDWLFIDRNQDGSRNRSKVEGWLEQDPAYGEPMFVPDDADRSGSIEPTEKVLQLGTSVIAAVRTDSHTYVRGVDLIDYNPTQDISSHGTGVSGILGGGQLPHQRATIGLAPEAELYVSLTTYDDADLAETLVWADDEGVDVVLHEYAPWTGFALDGSSAIESMVDTQQTDGSITHVCPVGNLADAGKHAVATTTAGTVTFHYDVPSSFYRPGFPWQYLWLEVHGEAATDALDQCTFVDPDGSPWVAPLDEWGHDLGGDLTLWSSTQRSGGDRPWHTLTLQHDAVFAGGEWTLSCDTSEPDGTTWHLFLNDYYSGWGRGITVHDEVRANTMGVPSTSQHCIAIGAYAGRHADLDVDVGELRSWSSRGPTVDGRRSLDLIAPDDPFAPRPSYTLVDWLAPYGPFGGTSGASPHVAALSALILQEDPSLTGLDVRELLMDAAEPVAGPLDEVGVGKVLGYEGWAGQAPPDAPALIGAFDVAVTTEGTPDDCQATLSVPMGLTAQVDIDYDGTVDIPWTEAPDLSALIAQGPTELRVEVADGGWVVGGGAATVEVPECDPVAPDPEPTDPEPTVPEDDTDDDAVADDAEETDEGKGGCGCQGGPRLPGSGGLLLLAFAGLRRRRR